VKLADIDFDNYMIEDNNEVFDCQTFEGGIQVAVDSVAEHEKESVVVHSSYLEILHLSSTVQG